MSRFDRLFSNAVVNTVVFVILAVGIIAWGVSEAIDQRSRPCSEFENRSARNLPARCISYWQNQ